MGAEGDDFGYEVSAWMVKDSTDKTNCSLCNSEDTYAMLQIGFDAKEYCQKCWTEIAGAIETIPLSMAKFDGFKKREKK